MKKIEHETQALVRFLDSEFSRTEFRQNELKPLRSVVERIVKAVAAAQRKRKDASDKVGAVARASLGTRTQGGELTRTIERSGGPAHGEGGSGTAVSVGCCRKPTPIGK